MIFTTIFSTFHMTKDIILISNHLGINPLVPVAPSDVHSMNGGTYKRVNHLIVGSTESSRQKALPTVKGLKHRQGAHHTNLHISTTCSFSTNAVTLKFSNISRKVVLLSTSQCTNGPNASVGLRAFCALGQLSLFTWLQTQCPVQVLFQHSQISDTLVT